MKWIKSLLRRLRAWSVKKGYFCDICRAEVFEYPKKRICPECENALARNEGRVCPVCGRQTVSGGVCLNCKAHAPRFNKAWSPFVYTGTVALAVNLLKNGGLRLVYFFVDEMLNYAFQNGFRVGRYALNGEKLVIVPVPLTKAKRKERGYNQAEELAFVIEKRLKARGVWAQTDEEILTKTRDTNLQKELSMRERRENLKGAYHVHKRKACKGATILLVDDIMTTGETGHECARVLKNAGAKRVYFFTCASLAEKKIENK
ncbi:MAG: ComF family protein [Clostridiales bacterium]|nr:ComF family protein [Clostridiales bacterium]